MEVSSWLRWSAALGAPFAPITWALLVMRDSNNVDDIIFNEVHERVWIGWEHVSSCADEVLRPLRRSIDNLVHRMIELAQEAGLCRFTACEVPSTIFLDLGRRIIEELETHYRLGRCR
jgi:hypothetical protein